MSHFPTTYWNLTRRLFEASLSIFYSQVPTCAAFGQKCNNWLGLSRDKFLSNFRTVMTSLLLLQKRWSVHRNYSSRWQIETHKNLQSHVSQKRNIHRTKSFKFSRIRAIEEEKAWNSAITATKNLWIYELFLQDSCFSLVIKPNFRHEAKGEGCVRFRVCVLAHGCLFNPTRHLQHGHFPFSPISNPLPPHSHSTIARPFRFHALLLFRQRTRKLIIAGDWWWFRTMRLLLNFSERILVSGSWRSFWEWTCEIERGWKLCPLKLYHLSNNRSAKIKFDTRRRLERNFDRIETGKENVELGNSRFSC